MREREKGEMRLWWIPQIPSNHPFKVMVENIHDAFLIYITLARYDAYQYSMKIKPDYSSAGGLEVWDGEEWVEWEDDNGDDIAAVIDKGEFRVAGIRFSVDRNEYIWE